MTRSFDLPETIAVFPLPGALLLPRSRLPLHIFEPRYLAMIDDALKSPDRMIAMVQPNPGRGSLGLHRIGCAGRITQLSETEDGRYMITLTGKSRFRIISEVEGFTPYRRCTVSWDGFERDRGPAEKDDALLRTDFMETLTRYFETKGLSTDWDEMRKADDELLINSMSMMLDFAPEDKQALLEAPSLTTRRETLVTLIEYRLRGGTAEGTLQ